MADRLRLAVGRFLRRQAGKGSRPSGLSLYPVCLLMKRMAFEQTGLGQQFETADGAASYASRHAGLMRRFAKRFARRLAEAQRPVRRLLDVGCGPGTLCIELARQLPEAEIVGADLSAPMLETARKGAREAGLAERVSFQPGDAADLPFEEGSFDAVVSVDTLNCVLDPRAMLSQCARVTAAGGTVLVATPRRGFLAYLVRVFRTGFTPDEMTRMARDAGLASPRVDAHLMFVTLCAVAR